MIKKSDVIEFLVTKRPGITERQLAEAMYGESVQQHVNQDCDFLVRHGRIHRDRSTRPARYSSIGHNARAEA